MDPREGIGGGGGGVPAWCADALVCHLLECEGGAFRIADGVGVRQYPAGQHRYLVAVVAGVVGIQRSGIARADKINQLLDGGSG